jgi:hypothetical protein
VEIAVLLISCLAAITVFVGNYRFFNDVLPRMIANPSNYYHHTLGVPDNVTASPRAVRDTSFQFSGAKPRIIPTALIVTIRSAA